MINRTQQDDPTLILWTARQTAAALQVSERTLYDWTREGVVPAIKVNRTVRYRPAAVTEALERLEAESSSGPHTAKQQESRGTSK